MMGMTYPFKRQKMESLLIQIKRELGYVEDNDLIKVLKRHKDTQHLETKKITGTPLTVNLYCFNGKYVVSDEISGESFRIGVTEKKNIAYQLHKKEIQFVKVLKDCKN